MPAIRGAREELERLKRQLANLEADGPPATVEAAKRRAWLERQMLELEEAIRRRDEG